MANPTRRLAAAALIVATLCSCKMGGINIFDMTPPPPPTGPPRILEIRPTQVYAGLERPESQLGDFSDLFPWIEIIHEGAYAEQWSWDFGGGAVPNTSVERNPLPIAIMVPGTYQGSVTIHNGRGSDSQDFTLTVLPMPKPQISSVTISQPGPSGEPGVPVTVLKADTAYEVVAAITPDFGAPGPGYTVEWDFSGDVGTYNEMQTKCDIHPTMPGSYAGTVTASSTGGTSSRSFSFSVVP